jgi:5-methylcytosine-specific restriction endonuclease McrA
MLDQIFSYREMCDAENIQTLQRGMNYRLNLRYSVILMSRRTNAPYRDRIAQDGITIEYEGHDETKSSPDFNPKLVDQPRFLKNGRTTQNGKFIESIEKYKVGNSDAEKVKVYEKLFPGVWSLKGLFNLVDYKTEFDGKRNVFIFHLRLSNSQNLDFSDAIDLAHTRLVSSEIKKEVWQRDGGKCVICGSIKNLHFDHDLPFSKGGTSLLAKNIRLLCAKCNLSKSNKIE